MLSDNQQGCSRLSNWFYLWCLRLWMGHLPRLWWSTFRLLVLKWQFVCQCRTVEGMFYWFHAFVNLITQVLPFSPHRCLLLWNNFCHTKYFLFSYSAGIEYQPVQYIEQDSSCRWFETTWHSCALTVLVRILSRAVFFIFRLWPLLLTWFNFNPSMDK